MRTLPRAVLGEAIGWFVVYAGAYFALIGLALGARLVRQGAPLDAVALFLIDQVVLFAVIVLPLAMVTAMLAVIGRMREEGEITALMAGGISTWSIGRALLPMAAAVALAIAYVAHGVIPGAVKRMFQGEGQLGQQMIATQVARRVPITAQGNAASGSTVIAAVGAEDQRLIGVFAVSSSPPRPDGTVVRRVCYAPEARWLWLAAEGQLGFDLREPVLLENDPAGPGRAHEIVSAFVENYWSIRQSDWRALGRHQATAGLFDDDNNLDDQPDAMPTPRLVATIRDPQLRVGRSSRYLWELQRTLHLRLILPMAVIGYWAFACGLGLAMGRGNRLFAMCAGIIVVVVTVMGPLIVVKNARGLTFDPGLIMWPPPLLATAVGCWLLWKRR